MSLEVTVGAWQTEDVAPTTPLGAATVARYRPMQPRMPAHTLGANWTRIAATIPKAVRPAGVTLNLLAAAATAAGGNGFAAGSLWVDDVSVVCVAGCPPPDGNL